jgi:hypothetical protein
LRAGRFDRAHRRARATHLGFRLSARAIARPGARVVRREPQAKPEQEIQAMSPVFRSLVLGLVALGGAACTQLAPEDRALIDRAASDAQRAADSAARAERSAQSANEAAQRAAADARAASERSERMFQRTQRKAAGS